MANQYKPLAGDTINLTPHSCAPPIPFILDAVEYPPIPLFGLPTVPSPIVGAHRFHFVMWLRVDQNGALGSFFPISRCRQYFRLPDSSPSRSYQIRLKRKGWLPTTPGFCDLPLFSEFYIFWTIWLRSNCFGQDLL